MSTDDFNEVGHTAVVTDTKLDSSMSGSITHSIQFWVTVLPAVVHLARIADRSEEVCSG
jgi:hypothetical protein